MEALDTLVLVALGVIVMVVVGSVVTLAVVIWYRRRCNRKELLFSNPDMRPEVHLISNGDIWSELELGDVRLTPQIDKILNDTQWVDDATGAIPHCLAILKLCHQMIERLVPSTLAPLHKDKLEEITSIIQQLSPRIDDVARAMYPPLDPRLLEARCSTLVLTLTLLVWHSKSDTSSTTVTRINEALRDIEIHLAVLREAAKSYENYLGLFADSAKNEKADC